MSDGKSRQVVANCKKELPDLKSPFSTPWDLGRKQNKKKGAVTISSRETVQQDSAENRLTWLTDGAKLQTSFPSHHTFPTAPGHLPPFPMPKSQSTKH